MSWDRIKVPVSHWEHEPYVDDVASSWIAAIGVCFGFVILVVWFGTRKGGHACYLRGVLLDRRLEEYERTRGGTV